MATITITVKDSDLQRVLDGVCSYYEYQETINGVANPETKAQFVKREIVEMIKMMTLSGEEKKAKADAVVLLNRLNPDIT